MFPFKKKYRSYSLSLHWFLSIGNCSQNQHSTVCCARLNSDLVYHWHHWKLGGINYYTPGFFIQPGGWQLNSKAPVQWWGEIFFRAPSSTQKCCLTAECFSRTQGNPIRTYQADFLCQEHQSMFKFNFWMCVEESSSSVIFYLSLALTSEKDDMMYFSPLTEVGSCCYLCPSEGESQEWSIKGLNIAAIKSHRQHYSWLQWQKKGWKGLKPKCSCATTLKAQRFNSSYRNCTGQSQWHHKCIVEGAVLFLLPLGCCFPEFSFLGHWWACSAE